MIKNVSTQWKISGQAQVAQNSWLIKIYIQYNELIHGTLCFSGKPQVDQKSWMEKIYVQYSEFRARSVFQGKRKLLKNPERWIYFPYSVYSAYSLGGDPVLSGLVYCATGP